VSDGLIAEKGTFSHPFTVNFHLHLHRAKMNQHGNYLGEIIQLKNYCSHTQT